MSLKKKCFILFWLDNFYVRVMLDCREKEESILFLEILNRV